ncbi:unnamed protein product [Paramecium primaurelia]|uniref:PARP catalytic domain-containing protein n=1 Tax=Paramecium primaurelia TaxID=5886 RepID=A0A8S1MXM1_PARPR|nr:unnamed protein product [Paramecium primaurelia]
MIEIKNNREDTQKKLSEQIYHVNQLIEKSNIEVLFYVLMETKLQEEYRQLQKLKEQQCQLRDLIQTDFTQFKQISSIRDLFVKPFNKNQINFLENVCWCSVDYLNFFILANNSSQNKINFCLDDFDPSHNKNWKQHQEKQQRGPPTYKYDYYYPRQCQGFGLKIDKFGQDKNWIKKDGNQNEWRILYHGTKHHFVTSIVQTGLKPGPGQGYQNDVGIGVYFSDRISVTQGYSTEVPIGTRKFRVAIMSRCKPQSVKQSQQMQSSNIFVVNNIQDIRPYRILLYEQA